MCVMFRNSMASKNDSKINDYWQLIEAKSYCRFKKYAFTNRIRF